MLYHVRLCNLEHQCLSGIRNVLVWTTILARIQPLSTGLENLSLGVDRDAVTLR